MLALSGEANSRLTSTLRFDPRILTHENLRLSSKKVLCQDNHKKDIRNIILRHVKNKLLIFSTISVFKYISNI